MSQVTIITKGDKEIVALEDKVQLLCDIANEHCLSIKDVQYDTEITIKNREDKILGYIYPIEIENLKDKVAEKFIDDPFGVMVIGLSEYIPKTKVTKKDIDFAEYVINTWRKFNKCVKGNLIKHDHVSDIISKCKSFKDLESYLANIN